MLVLVQHAVVTLVKDVDKLLGRLQAEQIVNLTLALVKQQFYVGFVKNALLAEVGLADSLPHFLALAGGSEHGLGLTDEGLAFLKGNVR